MSVHTATTVPIPWALCIRLPTAPDRMFPLDSASVQIGSDPSCTLVLDARQGVSKLHCKLTWNPPQLLLAANRSKNGTFVNSQLCDAPTLLQAGDRISVGYYTLELCRRADATLLVPHIQDHGAPLQLTDSHDPPYAQVLQRIDRYAHEWNARARPRNLLLGRKDIRLIRALLADPGFAALVAADPVLAPYIRTSLAPGLLPRVLFWSCGAAGFVLAPVMLCRQPAPAPDHAAPASDPAGPPSSTVQPTPEPDLPWVAHEVIPGETLDDIAALYHVNPAALDAWNPTIVVRPGATLQVRTAQPRLVRVEEIHVVGADDTWQSLSEDFGVAIDALQAWNPTLTDTLRADDRVHIWVEREPFRVPSSDNLPIYVLPKNAVSGGGVSSGWLENAVQLLPSTLCDVRCAAHAYGSAHTLTKLLEALRMFRTTYSGQIMIGDISQIRGGRYGPHMSHQSGRDIDVWLPHIDRAYRNGCKHCSTSACRPDSDEVDWEATWRLIRAFNEVRTRDKHGKDIGAVRMIFLSDSLFPRLREAAHRAGDAALAGLLIQPHRGLARLVMHSDGHVHHMHVRFRCGPDDIGCED